jgi:hypothetical protein
MTAEARCGCLHYLPMNVEEPDSPCKNCGHRETEHLMKRSELYNAANFYHPFVFVPCRALVGASLNVGQSS